MKTFLMLVWVAVAAIAARGEDAMPETIQVYSVEAGGLVETTKVVKSDAEWRSILKPEQFRVLRDHGTERPFTGQYCEKPEGEGIFKCAGCGTDLFKVDRKFDSGTGWPSFYEPIHPKNVGKRVDTSHFMVRTEVHCARCGGHLGHVFDDGPPPTGLRYCINSASLVFVPKKSP